MRAVVSSRVPAQAMDLCAARHQDVLPLGGHKPSVSRDGYPPQTINNPSIDPPSSSLSLPLPLSFSLFLSGILYSLPFLFTLSITPLFYFIPLSSLYFCSSHPTPPSILLSFRLFGFVV